jgi:hypothetical protein
MRLLCRAYLSGFNAGRDDEREFLRTPVNGSLRDSDLTDRIRTNRQTATGETPVGENP